MGARVGLGSGWLWLNLEGNWQLIILEGIWGGPRGLGAGLRSGWLKWGLGGFSRFLHLSRRVSEGSAGFGGLGVVCLGFK